MMQTVIMTLILLMLISLNLLLLMGGNDNHITVLQNVIVIHNERLSEMQRKINRLTDRLQQVSSRRESLDSQTGPVSNPKLTHVISASAPVGALTAFDGQLFVTRAGVGGEILVYSTNTFELTRKITFAGSGYNLYGLAPCQTNNDCLFVSDYWNSRVLKLDISQEHTTTSISWEVASRPHGLSVNKANNLLVAASESQMVQEYTSNGSFVREIVDGSNIFQAVELSDGTVVVSRFSPVHGVAVLSVNGTALRQYGSTLEGTGPGQMNEPRGLTVSKQGFVIVAEFGNNRIVVLNPTLTEARTLHLPTQLNNPHVVYLDDSTGRLYVGEWSSPYRVLVFDNVSVPETAYEP